MSLRQLLVSLQILLFCFFILFSSKSFAQTCIPNFHKIYGGVGSDEGLDVVNTSDGGSIVAGRTTSNRSSMDGVLMKLDNQGTILWTKSYGQSFYDELSKVRQTTDGGFITAGRTAESGSSSGNAWILRTDGNGSPLWSRKLASNLGPTRVKDLIQLKDGGYVVSLNINDSTDNSDGVLVRIGIDGNIIWSRSYDNGNNDGFHTVVEDGDFLVAGGYSKSKNRDGVVLKANVSDGAVVWSKKVSRSPFAVNDVVRIDVTPKGYMVALVAKKIVDLSFPGNVAQLFLVKIENESNITYLNRYNLDAGSPYTVGSVALKFAGDSSFIFTVSDTTTFRSSIYRKLVLSGFSTGFGRKVDGFHAVNSLEGIDSYNDKGVVLAGTIREWNTQNKIQVVKTDWQGDFGSCTGSSSGIIKDTLKYLLITPFSWNNTMVAVVSGSPVAAGEVPIIFTETVGCQKQDCVPASAVKDFGCNATFLAEYWNKYQLLPVEAVKVSDGYILCGSNRTTLQPVVIKVAFNGNILWSKTINSDHHVASFEHIRLMDDGNILLCGRGGYTVDHEGFTITVFVKMSIAGEVLWSKYIRGFMVDLKPTGDGSFTVLHYPDEASWGTIAKFKINSAGTITYKKRFNKSAEIIPSYRRMVLDGNDMYAAGEAWNSVVIEKLDSAGGRIWTKRVVNGSNQNARVEGTYLFGDSLYVTVRVITLVGWTTKHNLMLVKIGKDGKGINSVMIQQDFVDDRVQFFVANNMRFFHTAMTGDGNFVVADRMPGTPDSTIALIKFSPTGKILWSKNYTGLKQHQVMSVQDDGSGLTIAGVHFSYNNGAQIYNPLLIHTDNEGNVQAASGSICNAVPFVTTTAPFNLAQDFTYNSPTPNFEWLDFNEQWYQAEERLLETVPTSVCGIRANCSMVDLTGPLSVCNNGNTLIYNAQRNAECTVPIAWRFDTAIVQLETFTDSSLSVRYKRAGKTKIYGSIQTPCGSFVDSLEVTVLPQANMLNLGRDTTICPGNRIVLNATKGYSSYLWQDQSKDSILIVTQPGIYYVNVQDQCGGSFLDSIRVYPTPPIPFDIGADRVKCNSDTLHLQAPAGFLNYEWSNNYQINSLTTQNVIVNPLVDTFYSIKAEKTPGCFAYDTIHIKVYKSPLIDLGMDQKFCKGDSVVLRPASGFINYLWNNGNQGPSISVKEVGTYSVIGITTQGCRSYDTMRVLEVYPLPVVQLDQNEGLCKGEVRTLDAGNFASYQWQDGSSGRNFTARDTGLYTVWVTDNNGCRDEGTTKISIIHPVPKGFLPKDTSICSYGKLELKAASSYKSYLWSNGASAAAISITQPGIYWLQVKDNNNCVGKDTVIIRQKQCMNGFYIPSAFTPNLDGKNDVFRPLLFGNVQQYQFAIYNRWGQVVFQTSDLQKGWDGKLPGPAQDGNVFVWTCTYQFQNESVNYEKGTVTLIR